MQSGRGLALPHVLCALCLQSTLAASLRQLLLNDSLLDIGSRCALYLELVQLLKYLGESKQPQSFSPAAIVLNSRTLKSAAARQHTWVGQGP